MQKLSSWFFNTVYLSDDWSTVIKIPKATAYLIGETKQKLSYALQVHQEYLTDALPQTDIKTGKISSRWYYTEQEFIAGETLRSWALDMSLQAQLDDLITQGLAMEKDKKLFFDLYGRNWFIKNSPQLMYKIPNIIYTNCIITADRKIKYIDIWHLPVGNLLVEAWKYIRNFVYQTSTWKSIS
jgi:hypothetical protein